VKIFWDTNLFIYLWEKRTLVREMAALAHFVAREGHSVATSTLTLGEILVHPSRFGREDLVQRYREAMRELVLLPFDDEAAVVFGGLRARNPTLRPPDAVQLACAVAGGCGLFLTNDTRLVGVEGVSKVKVQSLAEWVVELG